MEKKKVIILGGGYAGLMTAVTLQKKVHASRLEIVLVNNNDYHYITTKIHEAGANSILHESIQFPIHELIDFNRVTFIQDEVIGLDIERRTVQCKQHQLSYDYVVVALGGSPKTFNIEGLEEHGYFLFNWEGTYHLRQHLEQQFKEYSEYPVGELNIVVGGTGFTGVEFIHELKHSLPALCDQYAIDPKAVRLIVVEANEDMLRGYPESIVKDAKRETNGICELRLGVGVSKVEKERVLLEDGSEITTRTFIWAGGVKGNVLLHPLEVERLDGRIKLNEYCEVPNHPDVYVLGDASVSFSEDGQPYPPTAQIAIQQGQYCAYHLYRKIYGVDAKPFRYIHRGTVMSLGKGNATGIVYGHAIHGRFAHLMKWVIEMRYYFMLGGIPLVLKQWKRQ